jgi:hypothetical protein
VYAQKASCRFTIETAAHQKSCKIRYRGEDSVLPVFGQKNAHLVMNISSTKKAMLLSAC